MNGLKAALCSLLVLIATAPLRAQRRYAQFDAPGVNRLFGPPVNFYAGLGPVSIAVADFNHDGHLDVAVGDLNSDPENVSVLLGNGDGTFQLPITNNIGTSPVSIAVGDFNNDGNLDFAAAITQTNGGQVSVALGNGDGTFRPGKNFRTGGDPTSIAAADLNGDGKIDLATANLSGNDASVLLGNGDGTFQKAVNYKTTKGATGIVIADLNADGIPDLALANQCQNNCQVGSINVLVGNGDGTFQTLPSQKLESPALYLAAGDVNGDGFPDLVVTQYIPFAVQVLLNNGNGTFRLGQRLSLVPTNIAVADFDGDGKLDLAVTVSGAVEIAVGNGDGTFKTPIKVNIPGGSLPQGIVAADLNGDAKPDLAIANMANALTVLLNTSH